MKIKRGWRVLIFAGLIVGGMTMGIYGNPAPAEAICLNQASGASLTLTKTGSPSTFAQAGDQITYTYVVEVDLSNVARLTSYLSNLSVTDDHTTVQCPRTYATGEVDTITCTSTYTVTEADVAAGQVKNNAAASGEYEYEVDENGSGCGSSNDCNNDGCGNENDDCGNTKILSQSLSANASFTATLEAPAVSLDKTGSPATFSQAGQEIKYTYEVKNTGMGPLTGITLSDSLVTVTCPGSSLGAGESMQCSAVYTTTPGDVSAGSITNHAAVSAGSASADDSFTVTLQINPALGLTKSADPGSFTRKGQVIHYSFVLTNTGNVPLEGPYKLQDVQLDQQKCPDQTLAPGDSLTCDGYYRTRSKNLNTTIHNCATGSGYYNGAPVTSSQACTNVYFQAPKERNQVSACAKDPESFECYCQQNPQDPDCNSQQ